MPILATKLYIPRPRPKVVSRPRLLERLNLWQNHTGQRMGRGNRAAGGLAVIGRRGERPGTLSDPPRGRFAEACACRWGRDVECAPIRAAPANRSAARGPAQ